MPNPALLRCLLTLWMTLWLAGCASIAAVSETNTRQEAAQINFKLGIGYMQAGRFDLAEAKLTKALEFDSALSEADNALGVLYETTGSGKTAEKHYRQALKADANYALARMNLGRLLCANGKTQDGEQQFLTVLKNSDFDSPEVAYTGAGVCARKAKRNVQAEQYFRQALAANPYAAAPLLEIATLNYEQRQFQDARQHLERYHKQAGL